MKTFLFPAVISYYCHYGPAGYYAMLSITKNEPNNIIFQKEAEEQPFSQASYNILR